MEQLNSTAPSPPSHTPSQTISTTTTTSTSPSPSAAAFDPHNTDWHNVDLLRFTLWMSIFSIGENAIFYPFYVLKTREQSDRGRNYRPLESTRYHLTNIVKTQGVARGLYRGFFASSLVSLPAYGLYSGVYTWSKEKLGYTHTPTATTNKWLNYAAPFISGIIADAASVVLYVPGDVIVQRMQIANSPYKSFSDACVKVWKHEGIQGFYAGFGATFITGAIASAIWWMTYENSKRFIYRMKEENSHSQSQSVPVLPSSDSLWALLTEVNRTPQLIAGFIAGTVTSVVINPLDVVKTRLQVQKSQLTIVPSASSSASLSQSQQSAPPRHYRNFFHGLVRVYKDEGMRGYVRGVMPKLISRGPISAMSSLMYELVLYLSRTDRQELSTSHKRMT